MSRVCAALAIAGALVSAAVAQGVPSDSKNGTGTIYTPSGKRVTYSRYSFGSTTNTVINTPAKAYVCNTTRVGSSSITSCF
jgi:hypothetical protein